MSLTVLVVFYGGSVVLAGKLDDGACRAAAQRLRGNPQVTAAVCISKSCLDAATAALPGWTVECYERGSEPLLPTPAVPVPPPRNGGILGIED